MNKSSKYLLVTGISIVCLSLIISVITKSNLIKPFTTLGNNNYTEKYKEFDTTDLKSLVVKASDQNVTIIKGSSDTINIRYFESDYYKYSFSTDNNTIIMTTKTKIKFFNFDLDFFSPYIEIEIPESLIIEYNIKTSNSKIEISKLNIHKSTFTSSNGKVVLKSINSDNKINIKTSNASINLSSVKAPSIIAKTSNGKITFNKITANFLSGDTSNSSINVTNTKVGKEILLDTSNGRIELDKLSCPLIDVKTSNSRIEGSIVGSREDYVINAKTSNSHIELDDTDYGTKILDTNTKDNYLKLKTSNGRIDINFIS